MIKLSKSMQLVLFLPIVIGLNACSSVNEIKDEYIPDAKKVDYKKSRTEPSLEIPPDLISSSIDDGLAIPDLSPSGTASLSDYTAERAGGNIRNAAVLPEQPDIRVERDRNTRWLVIKGEPAAVWPRMREFWLQNGFLIKREDPRIGILETDWAENREDIPGDFITDYISKLFDSLYSAATRDKFRVRLEEGVAVGTTEVYLTHRGAEEVLDQSTEGVTLWKPRPADPELEIEMMRRMAVFFGVEEQKSRTLFARKPTKTERARLTRSGDGASSLSVEENFARAWRRTGLALDRVGFTVEDRDRSRGLYYVRYVDPNKDSNNKKEKGFLDKINVFSSDDDAVDKTTYLVSLKEEGGETFVRVLNNEGEPENTETAYRILTLLHEQLK